jgi:hypothetical protein
MHDGYMTQREMVMKYTRFHYSWEAAVASFDLSPAGYQLQHAIGNLSTASNPRTVVHTKISHH